MPFTFQPYPRSGWPLSVRELRKGQENSPQFYFSRFQALHDVFFFEDDFMYKALNTTNLYTANAGATATAFAAGTLEDGNIRGQTGTTAATSGLQVILPVAHFTGSRNYGCEVRWQTSAVTNIRIECGFVDALPAVNTNIVNSLTTPSYNTTAKAALYVFDNASATNTLGLYTIGSSGAAAAKQAFTSPVPTASQFTTLRIQANSTEVNLFVDGIFVGYAPSGITAADSVEWCFSATKADTSNANIDIDYLMLWKDRNTVASTGA